MSLRSKHILSLLLALFLALSLLGCADLRPAKYTSLASWPYLRSNAADREGQHQPFRYALPVAWSKYTNCILEPVVIYNGANQQFGSMSAADKTTLAAHAHSAFRAILVTRFEQADRPSPNTLRITVTLTGARTTTAVIGQLVHVDIAGNAYNAAQSWRNRQGAFSGYVIYAVEVRDSLTNKLLLASINKQYPDALDFASSFNRLDAARSGIDRGAKDFVAELK